MALKRVLRNLDYQILVTVALIVALGLAVMSTTQPGGHYYMVHQAVWVAVGVVGFLIMLSINYEALPRLSYYLYGLMILLLLWVLVKGTSVLGGERWINLGPFQLQPSEVAKVVIILTLAHHLTLKQGQLKRARDLLPFFAHVGIPMLLIFKQPDLGTAMVFAGILFGMLIMAGAPLPTLLGIYGGGAALVILDIVLHLRYGVPIPLHDYQLQRLLVFLNPYAYYQSSGYQIVEAMITLGSGGLTGAGIQAYHGVLLSFLPSNQTDFIFAVVGRDLGFLGAGLLLLLYFYLLIRGLRVAVLARDFYGSMLAAGVVSFFAFHVLVNAAMAVALLPVVGVPLPFVSYGGSAMLANFLALGLLLNVYAHRRKISF